MTDVMKELQAYLDGDNSVVMSKRLVSETIAELAAANKRAANRLVVEAERDELHELLGKAWVALYTTGALYDDDMRRIAAVLNNKTEKLYIKVDGNVGTPKPNQKIEIKRGEDE